MNCSKLILNLSKTELLFLSKIKYSSILFRNRQSLHALLLARPASWARLRSTKPSCSISAEQREPCWTESSETFVISKSRKTPQKKLQRKHHKAMIYFPGFWILKTTTMSTKRNLSSWWRRKRNDEKPNRLNFLFTCWFGLKI